MRANVAQSLVRMLTRGDRLQPLLHLIYDWLMDRWFSYATTSQPDNQLVEGQAITSLSIHPSSTLGNSSALGSRAYCRSPNIAGR